MKRCLDLFAGLGGFSAAFEDSPDWEVTTVDIEERFDPDICADVFDLRPSDFDPDFDVILASVPCTQFSLAASSLERFDGDQPQTPAARDAVALVYHTIGLIRGLAPTYWFLENPMGYLRQVLGEPEGRVTYCQYGTDWMKPTDLWGEHPLGFQYRTCAYGDDCHQYNTDGAHGGEGNCNWVDSDGEHVRDPAERAKVPYELSAAILEAVEGRAEQSTLTEVVG